MPRMDHDHRITISVNGRRVSARGDRSLLAALTHEHLPVLTRSLKYHRPRAPFCGTGQCTGCLVRVNGEPSVRACEYLPREGDVVRTQRGWPSTQHDLWALFDRLFPRYLDTTHGFTRPAFLRPVYTRFVRRFSGQGAVPDDAPGPLPRPLERETPVLVVGGGQAALSVASELVRMLGPDRVLHIGHPKRPGLQHSLLFLRPPVRGVFEAVAYRQGEPALRLQSRAVVLATGAYDASLLFPGNDRPGVMTAEGAETFASGEDGPPFRHALLFGAGPRAVEMLSRLKGRVALVATPWEATPELAQEATRQSIPLHPGQLLLSAEGPSGIQTAVLKDRRSGATTPVSVDAIVLAHRRIPHAAALFQAGALMQWRDDPGAYFPVLASNGATSVPGLYAIGEVAGSGFGAFPEEEAHRVAQSVVAQLEGGKESAPEGAPSEGPVPGATSSPGPECPMLSYYRDFLRERPQSKVMLCACEDVCLDEMEGVVREGWGGLEVAKRISGVGMGLCQGRYCVPETMLVLSLLERRPPSEIGTITQRPPIWPVPLGALAGTEEGTP